jgi:glycosyltransferase involved in cell wall biosynthesis
VAFTVLYDGWSLVYQPNSPAALHLLALIAKCPDEVRPLVALPASPPAWFPGRANAQVFPTANTLRARLVWEQRSLPDLVRKSKARWLHLTSLNPPLFGLPISVVSPAGYEADLMSNRSPEPPAGFIGRVRQAVSQGGMSRLRGFLWPADLPETNLAGPVLRLPPCVPDEFYREIGAESEPKGNSNGHGRHSRNVFGGDIPDGYVLYHGPGDLRALKYLLGAWSWAAGPIGEDYPLAVLGLDGNARSRLAGLAADYGLADTIHIIPEVSPEEIAGIYQNCSALIHLAPVSPWGSSIRFAMASGKPIVAAEEPMAAAMVGPAGYLVKPEDARAADAALITIIIEESVAESLSKAAHQRALAWRVNPFGEELLQAYESM